MKTAISLEAQGEHLQADVEPAMLYTPTSLSIRGGFGSIELYADDEQLEQIEIALRTYRESKHNKEATA